MTVQILGRLGTGGIRIFTPPLSIQDLPWEKATDTFKQEFLQAWNNAYEWEEYESNAGINQLSLLDDMAKRLNESTLDPSLSFSEAYQQELKETLASLHE